ncbi:MAG: hypothetical protein AAFX92_12195 [Pseudomonadota bacterium]
MRLRHAVIAAALALVTATPAAAQDYPDLLGTWAGVSETIVAGSTNHHQRAPGETQPDPRLVSVPITVIIDQQDGRRFSGTVNSPSASERIVGVVTSEGRILWVDEDGYNEGVMIDDDRMDICYLLVQPLIQLASCVEMVRDP